MMLLFAEEVLSQEELGRWGSPETSLSTLVADVMHPGLSD